MGGKGQDQIGVEAQAWNSSTWDPGNKASMRHKARTWLQKINQITPSLRLFMPQENLQCYNKKYSGKIIVFHQRKGYGKYIPPESTQPKGVDGRGCCGHSPHFHSWSGHLDGCVPFLFYSWWILLFNLPFHACNHPAHPILLIMLPSPPISISVPCSCSALSLSFMEFSSWAYVHLVQS